MSVSRTGSLIPWLSQAAILMLQQPDAPEIAAADEEMAALAQDARQKQVLHPHTACCPSDSALKKAVCRAPGRNPRSSERFVSALGKRDGARAACTPCVLTLLMATVAGQVVSMLVSEIVLCIKEVNKRTRIAAYELLVGLARAMHEDSPPAAAIGYDASMGITSSKRLIAALNWAPGSNPDRKLQVAVRLPNLIIAQIVRRDPGAVNLHAESREGEDRGGLHTLFTMILGGLVGASPHMISASVMALARLLYEFAPQLQASTPQLLPVVLTLLRSKSREVVKSVLGFVKVGPKPVLCWI